MTEPTHIPGEPEHVAARYSPWDDHKAGIQHHPTHIPKPERNALLRELGSVVYAVRLDDGVIKIGCTTNLARRLAELGVTSQADVLAVILGGTLEDEQAIHARLDGHQHHGREFYYPTRAVLAAINEMREQLGLEPVAA